MGSVEAKSRYYQEDELEAVRRAKRKLAQELESKGDNNGKRREHRYFVDLYRTALKDIEFERKVGALFCEKHNNRRKKAADR